MRVFLAGVLCCFLLPGQAFAQEQLLVEITGHAKGYAEAFNRHDAKAVAGLWSETGDYHNLSSGLKIEGRDQIASSLENFFQEHSQARMVLDVNRIRPVTEQVARAEGTSQLLLGDGTSTSTTFQVLYVRQGDNWVIDSLTETEARQLTSQEALQELSWLLGTWQDESDDILVKTSCRWSRTNTFLIRTFLVQRGEEAPNEGTQIIGWDPLYRQIRSWNFYSDGSFGTAFWSRNGDEWLVKNTHTLTDGRVAQGTHVFSEITSRTMTVQLTSYSIEGELQPARDPVVVVRIEDEESVDNAAATPAAQGVEQ